MVTLKENLVIWLISMLIARIYTEILTHVYGPNMCHPWHLHQQIISHDNEKSVTSHFAILKSPDTNLCELMQDISMSSKLLCHWRGWSSTSYTAAHCIIDINKLLQQRFNLHLHRLPWPIPSDISWKSHMKQLCLKVQDYQSQVSTMKQVLSSQVDDSQPNENKITTWDEFVN